VYAICLTLQAVHNHDKVKDTNDRQLYIQWLSYNAARITQI
jgi:hypothetical protein